ncbi:MAG: phage baseplate assembly protein V, partial [Tannerella sp.]|nr:phage baseplate assembly protein V [Tannerella sp.]
MKLNTVEVKLSIAGKDCYIISMILEQGFNQHHRFECVVDYEEFDTKWMESPGKVFKLLGEDAIIEMKHKDGKGLNFFKGVITHISHTGHHGGQNHICISGCSPTIKLEGSKTMDSFMDMNLDSIVSEAVGTSGNGGSIKSQPGFTEQIDYICQYNETCFEFLNRLSWIYGEWFFYDGQDCYFGKQDGKEEEVTFESELTTFDLSANLLPSKMKRYHYLVHDDRETDMKAPDPSTAGYHLVAQGKSSSIYTSDATLPSIAEVLADGELDTVTRAEKNRATFGMLTMSGTSQTSKVKIGGKIKVKLPDKMKTTKKDVDTFLVTSVIHEFDLKAQYRNSFMGIPSTVEYIPMQPVVTPVAQTQLAWVKENVDEKERGRIKVQLQWQKDKGKTTNWIRVQTLDAGTSGPFPQNRGHVFIPELDDQVMIGFEYGDPNRPYMTGSMFPERHGKGGEADNNIKSIKTRSGHKIEFNDSEGNKSITITDIAGNIIF